MKHVLYKKSDKDCPDHLKDNNGDVVLDQCMICGKAEIELDKECVEHIIFTYKNYRGEVNRRFVKGKLKLYFGSTEWHPEKQWLITGHDLVKNASRSFALKDCNFRGEEE